MSNKLGRGLNQLFKDNYLFDEEVQDNEVVIDIPIDELKENPYQPRKTFDEQKIDELAQSISEHGVLQPIIVKKSEIGYYLVAGERRLRACKKLGRKTIPGIVRELSDQTMAEVALMENLQREDLSILEEAMAYQTLINKYSITQTEIASRIGKSRSHVTNALRLLNLPKEVQEMIRQGEIEFGHAKVIAGLQDEALIIELANKIKSENLSVRQLEELLNSMREEPKPKEKPEKKKQSLQMQYLQDLLISKLGTPIRIRERNKGGKIEIDFADTNDLNRLLAIMQLIDDEN